LRVDSRALDGLSEAERASVVEELAAVEEAVKLNPLLIYHPHAKQVEFHTQPHPPLRAFFGGNRSGKTTATMVDTILQCVDRDVVPEHLKGFKKWEPPFYCRVVTPDLTNTLEGVVLQKFREWCPKSQFKGGGFDRSWDKVQRVLRFKNGSWIQFFSNDQDLDKFGGAALHRVVYDEEPRADIRRESLMRLIDYGGEELFGMTPLNGMSWTYDEVYEPWERGELVDGRVVVVDMDDNPHLDRTTMQRVLAGLSDEERQARKSGRFVAFAGLIYPEFSTKVHVRPAIQEVPPGVEVFCGIDPGIRHMCAVVYAYLDHEDTMVVFDEIGLQGATVREVCREIQLRNLRWGTKKPDGKIIPLLPRWYVIDPASRNRANQTGRSDQQEFADNGVYTIPGQNDVRAGINRVKERLQASPDAKLVVTANCSELLSEFKKYRWTRENGRSENEARDVPVKKDDHLLDALRYVCAQRPLVPERDRALPTDTLKDRLLRESLKRLGRMGGKGGAPLDHFAGPGVFN
jgi:hypothetical protein